MATGTGYPVPKAGQERTAVQGTVQSDSGASQWQRIANIGESISKQASNIGEKEAYQQYVAAISEKEVEGRDFERSIRDKAAFEPQKYEAEMRKFIDEKLGSMDPRLVPHMRNFYSRQMDAGHASVLSETRTRNLGLQSQTLSIDVEQKKGIVNDLIAAGQKDTPAFKTAVDDLIGTLNSGVNSGLTSSAMRDKVLADTTQKGEEDLAGNNAIKIAKKESYEAAVAHLQKMRNNTGSKISEGDRQRIYDKALNKLNEYNIDAKRQTGEIVLETNNVMDQAVKGDTPTSAKMAELGERAKITEKAAVQKNVAIAEEVVDLVTAMRPMPIPQARARLEEEKAKARAAGDTAKVNRLSHYGERLLNTMNTEINKNLLGWSQKTGRVPITPIDFAGDPIAAAKALESRIAAANELATEHNRPADYLLDGERVGLAAQLARGGDNMVRISQIISRGAGPTYAPKVFNEIAKDAPVLAHVGHLAETNPRLAADTAETLEFMQNPENQKRLPRNWANRKPEEVKSAQDKVSQEVTGGAFILVPRTGDAVLQTGNAAYFSRGRRSDADPTLRDNPSDKLYRRTLQEAAGAIYDRDGTQRGGLTTVTRKLPTDWVLGTGFQVLVPATVKANRFEDLLKSVNEDDLKAHKAPPWNFATGQAYTAATLRGATPVLSPTGNYRFALGNPGGADPQWIQGKNGEPFELDWDVMEPIFKKRMPSAF